MMRVLLLLSVLLSAFAAPSPQPNTLCKTNAECLKRGLPLLTPARRKSGALRPRASPLPPTPSSFSYTGAVQTFNPQSDGYYTITAIGASGGVSQGPNNAIVAGGVAVHAQAVVWLTAGSSFSVVVGGQGASGIYGNSHAGGGGGGSFVYSVTAPAPSDPILVAGGGGGAGFAYNGQGGSGQQGTSGAAGGGTGLFFGGPGAGGTGGGGGSPGESGDSDGGGGAGWLASGSPAITPYNLGDGHGGQTGPTWTGGDGDDLDPTHGNNEGGFGGGGGGGYYGGGGGGGYSGGGGGSGNEYGPGGGGGGGSFAIANYNGYATQALFNTQQTSGDGSVTFVKNP